MCADPSFLTLFYGSSCVKISESCPLEIDPESISYESRLNLGEQYLNLNNSIITPWWKIKIRTPNSQNSQISTQESEAGTTSIPALSLLHDFFNRNSNNFTLNLSDNYDENVDYDNVQQEIDNEDGDDEVDYEPIAQSPFLVNLNISDNVSSYINSPFLVDPSINDSPDHGYNKHKINLDCKF